MSMRIDKFLSHAGLGSRSVVRKLIKNKKVFCNDILITKDDFKVNTDLDVIKMSGEVISYVKFVYIMLHKPAGYITANKDNMHKVTKSLIPEYDHFDTSAVGRLDIDTEGLLLITNDGALSHNLLSPKKHVDKTYYVEFSGPFMSSYMSLFEKGITLDDGYITMPSTLILLSEQSANLTIQEGKFHQVKRMFAALEMTVTYLKRIKFGPLLLEDDLPIGTYRLLHENEIKLLKSHKEV